MNYYSILTDFYQKLFSDGLDVNDYYLLKDYLESLNKEFDFGIVSDEEFKQLLPDFRKLCNILSPLSYSQGYNGKKFQILIYII